MADKPIRLLGIVGSPRKGGNTEIAVGEALKAGEQEGAVTEMIYLADYDLKPCQTKGSCPPYVCRQTGNCVIKDDVEKLYEKVAEADGIIIGAPVHGFAANSHTGIFLERVGMLDTGRKRRAFRNKVGGAIALAGRYGQRVLFIIRRLSV